MQRGILAKRVSRENVGNVIDEMGKDIELYKSNNGKITPYINNELDVTIRWGCTSSISSNIMYNKRTAIKKASNKLRARKIFRENEINIPKTWENPNNCEFPLIARPKYHWGGKNFYYCEDKQDLYAAIREGAEYFSEFYPKTREFRVHISHGKVLICCEKFVEDKDKLIWNLRKNKDSEWQALRWSNIDPSIAKLAIQSIKALGLDYGAVDILAEPKDNRSPNAVVIEVNTAPRLGDYSSSRYAEYFDWLLHLDERKEWVDADYNHGWRGFVWSHEDLELE